MVKTRIFGIISSVIFFLILSFCADIHAQNRGRSSEPITLEYADSLVGISSPSGGIMRELIGNVRITQGKVRITCDRAIQFVEQNKAELIGRVVITQNDMTIRTPRGVYDGNTKVASGTSGIELRDAKTTLLARAGTYSMTTRIANFFGDVSVNSDSLLIISDTLEYNRASGESFSTGNVWAKAKFEHFYLRGDSVSNFPDKHYTRVVGGNPMLVQIDSARADSGKTGDTLLIRADVLEAFREQKKEKYIATGGVEILRKPVFARCGLGVFEKSNDKILLTNAPILWLDSTQLTADFIQINLKQNKVETILAQGNAFSATRDSVQTNRFDQLSGEDITVELKGDVPRSILAERKAFSLYFAYTDAAPDGVAQDAADAIEILFDGKKVEEIHWTKKVEGGFYPEQFVGGRLNEYQLKNFKWESGKPILKMFPERTIREKEN